MIRNARVLQPEFVPRDVVHRQYEINTLTAAMEPILEGEKTDPAFLFGPSGAGKTCIAQYTTEKLRENVIDLNYQYVNCWEDYSRFKPLYRVLEGIDETIDIHRQSTPRDVLLDRLREYNGPPYVVILDEVDQLEDKRVLYELYRTSNLSMVLIANDEEELFADINSRLSSRLQTSERISFDRYNMDSLIGILQDRARWGLKEDAISNSQLENIADAAAGDARVAIGILRNAAQKASQADIDVVSDEVLREAIPAAKAEIQKTNLEKLTQEQQRIYEIIDSCEEIAPSELYSEYRQMVEDPKTNRTVRNYLRKMERYNLIESVGENRGRTYKSAN